MDRLFSNKKINKSRQDIKGYTFSGSCPSNCASECSGSCYGGCYGSCGYGCFKGSW